MRKFYLLLPFILILIGVIGMITTLFLNDKKESSLLFSDISGFVVDSNNNIYVGLGLHGKIQVYNKDGEFLRLWSTECNQSYLELTKEENILVTSVKCDEQYTYNSLGKLLNITKKEYSFNDSIQNNWDRFISKQGEIYKITSAYNIVKLFPKKKTIVSQSFCQKVLKCTLLYWIIFASGITIGVYVAFKKGLIQKNW